MTLRLLAWVLGVALFAGACGDDDPSGGADGGSDASDSSAPADDAGSDDAGDDEGDAG